MEWFRLWTEDCIGPSEIARRNVHKVSRQSVCRDLHRVAEWMRVQTFDIVMTIRDRQTRQLELVMEETWRAWRKSIGEIITVTTADDLKNSITTTRREVSHGNPAYLQTMMDAAKAIRDIWGVNTPAKSEGAVRHSEVLEGMPMGQGHGSRAEALRAAASAINAIADRSEISQKRNALIETGIKPQSKRPTRQ